jgi:hypothetical protein
MEHDHPFLKKRKSRIDGIGIFTEQAIDKGKAFYSIPMSTIVSVPAYRLAYVGKGKHVDDDAVLNWINHSCDPNTILDISTDQPCLISIRDIAKGEEITCDYDLTEKDSVAVECHCKRPDCRGYFLRIER